MLLSISIQSIATWVIVLLLACCILYAFWKNAKSRLNTITPANKAFWCIRNDPKIAKAVLNLAYLESAESQDLARRRKRFVILELHSRLRHHISDKEEIRLVCRQLIHTALNLSKKRGDRS